MKMFAHVDGEQSMSRQGEGLPLNGLRGLLSFVRSQWATWHDIRAGREILDAIPESQLQDLGLRRVGDRVRWMDHCETLQLDEFEYRAPATDHANDERA